MALNPEVAAALRRKRDAEASDLSGFLADMPVSVGEIDTKPATGGRSRAVLAEMPETQTPAIGRPQEEDLTPAPMVQAV